MDSKHGADADGSTNRPLRTSDRVRRRPTILSRSYLYYQPVRKKGKSKKRTAASQIAKLLHPGRLSVRSTASNSVATNLRRSTRKRKIAFNLEDYGTDSSDLGGDIMRPVRYHGPRPPGPKPKTKHDHGASQDDEVLSLRKKNLQNHMPTSRREGLRPRRTRTEDQREFLKELIDAEATSDEETGQDETENGDEVEDIDEGEAEAEGEDEEEVGDGEDEGDDEDGEEEEQEGGRRYDLRERSEVRKFSSEKEGKPSQQSLGRVLHQGMGTKNNRDMRKGSSRAHKRHRLSRADDSDDSLLVDELDQGPGPSWGRAGSRGGPPWPFGGFDMHGTSNWGLNIAASGWSHQGDSLGALITGVQTAGPSSKGGADIQPVQVDESVSFEDIGGLSEYINALKEMVFFPLLYPDFFAKYHITPPRGVLLCGPPGTGKTLIARALACAASKAGQKVSFYMRKGADVLSKWVGEAERQLKLLFEEAQRNQPSIIFFDEIDGLAPVRSSKQEQIHNSIVSTLLALMDGLDSRGQVVLIGATNRIDAIDGALRRPGRFDREFIFPLPGCDARADILDIHTRKWKEPPSKELKAELAATCVGYCGADLKALCTEAAIRAFREKYPQVYTSDDKFIIDVDSVKVELYHFFDATSTITPAAHRGSIVHSRPLSSVVAPCLERHLKKVLDVISEIFPFLGASDGMKMPPLACGSAVSLVYRPRLLISGAEGVGLDHMGPAVLHELEKFPVFSLGLPSLLSDPSAKAPEEALVHIFCEARRTVPSILYLPQFQLWWETAHEQLKAVFLSLLDDLPSNSPILLLGTSTMALSDLEQEASCVFSQHNVYEMMKPTREDRSRLIEGLFQAAFSVSSNNVKSKSKEAKSLSELPKAPKATTGPKISELKAKAEAEQHALRRLRMCLRDVCNRILYDKRFTAFHYPVLDEEAPNYHTIVQKPMDMATMLQRVDTGTYVTCSTFVQDVDLIVSNAKAYNGDDYNGSRIVSRAHELRDAVHGMLSQMDPALVTLCDKIDTQGGPVHLPDDIAGLALPATPVLPQTGTTTRMSARLRHVQLEVNLCQSYEALKRTKKNIDMEDAGVAPEASTLEDEALPAELEPVNSASASLDIGCGSAALANGIEKVAEASEDVCRDRDLEEDDVGDEDLAPSSQLESIKQRLVERTEGNGVPQLERLYTRVMKGVIDLKRSQQDHHDRKSSILKFLLNFIEDKGNF